MSVFSRELQLALAPRRTYEELLVENSDTDRFGALASLAFAALVIGTCVAMSSTGRVALGLVLSTTACWAFVVVIQGFAATCIIASSPRRVTSRGRAFDLFFMGHVPWSLWLLAAAAGTVLAPATFAVGPFAVSALIPAVWTMVIISAFCRTVLACTVREMRLKTLVHQTIVWTMAGLCILVGSGWTRVLGVIGR